MANTTNFGWETPDDTDLVKDGAAAMRTLGNSIDASFVDLKGGTTGQILSKNSNTDLDYVWITNDQGDITGVTATAPLTGGGTSGAITVGIQDGTTTQKGAVQLENSTSSTSTTTAAVPASVKSAYDLADGAIPKTLTSTTGDLIYASAANTPARLAIGSTSQVLTVAGGVPTWATASGGKVVQIVSASYATQTATSSTNFSDTGITATITPASSSNKILILCSVNGVNKNAANTSINTQLLRGATVIVKLGEDDAYNNTTNTNAIGSISTAYMDSPATTSATTYKVQFANGTGTGSAVVCNSGARSTIQLIEVTP